MPSKPTGIRQKAGDTAASGANQNFRASRHGKKGVLAYFEPDIAKRLKHLAVDEDSSIQALMHEAVDDLLAKRKGSRR